MFEVHQIMTRDIAEVLGQGERLDRARPCPLGLLRVCLFCAVWHLSVWVV